MTTQTQGKGKKKNKEVMKLSLDEFNQIDAPHGHSVVSLKMTGLDWAETMADHDQQATETQQIIVPAAPRAQRGPGVDYDSLPAEPPFRASLYNVPISVEEKEITDRFFQELSVLRVESTKTHTTVEFASRQDLYDALCKDGINMKGRTVNVCLYGQSPPNNNYGSRGGSSYGDRGQGGFGQRAGDRYGDRSGGFGRDREGGFGRDREGGFGRDREGGFSRGGFSQSRSGYGDRFNDRSNYRDSNRGQYTSGGGEPVEESSDWRARPNPTIRPNPPPAASYNNGSRPSYSHSRPDSYSQQSSPAPPNHQQYQSEPYQNQRYNQPSNHSSYAQSSNQGSFSDRPLPSSSTEERPKLNLKKRNTPLNPDDLTAVNRNEAIFGKAKPSSTPYEKMKEVEEKLKAVQLDEKPRK